MRSVSAGTCARCDRKYVPTTVRQQICPDCKLQKCDRCGGPYERKNGKQRYCKTCSPIMARDRSRKAYHANLEKSRERVRNKARERVASGWKPTWEQRREAALRTRFKIGLDDYYRMLAEQGDVCAICGAPPPAGRLFHVDHDHTCCPDGGKSCGKCVRGLLCSRCNTGIGGLRDDVQILKAAIDYLLRKGEN